MSTFLQLLQGATKSNTARFNTIIIAILTALVGTDMIQANPDLVKIGVGVIAALNLIFGAADKNSEPPTPKP